MKTINTDVPPSNKPKAQSSGSSAKSETNRRNALKSTGPKTPIGKKNVRFNALKHGFYAQDLIIRPECKAEIERLRSDLLAQLLPKTPLQRIAFKAVIHWAWQCELAAQLDMGRVNALLYPPDAQESDTDDRPAMEYLYTSSPEDLRQGIRFLEYLKLKVESRGEVPEELKDSVRKGFGPRFLDLLDQPKSPIGRQALLLADHLVRHAKTFRRPLPPLPKEGPKVKVIIDPQQSLQALLNLIEVKKEFLNDLRQSRGQEETNRVSAGDSPPRYFADATRALRRAVAWYQYLVANNL
jgi:hypothetical protein